MKDPFGLTDADYWTSPFRTLPDFAWDRIGAGVSGVVIGCPGRVDLDARSTLPMLAYYSDTLAARARTPFDRAVVVAVDEEHGAVYAAVAEPREEPPQGGDPGPGFAGSEHLVDLRDRLALPWARGAFSVVVLMREQISDRALVRLERGTHRYADPEADRFVAAAGAARAAAMLTARSGDPVVRRGASAAAPAPPADPGLVLEGDRVVERRPGAVARLGLSFRLPIGAGDLTREEGAPPLATLPIHLVVVGSLVPTPIVVPVRLPTAETARGPGAGVAVGRAEIDLLRVASLPAYAQTYVVWAVARGAISAPLSIALVLPDAAEGG